MDRYYDEEVNGSWAHIFLTYSQSFCLFPCLALGSVLKEKNSAEIPQKKLQVRQWELGTEQSNNKAIDSPLSIKSNHPQGQEEGGPHVLELRSLAVFRLS